MKYISLFIALLLPFVVYAKDLPSVSIVKERLDGAQITQKINWENYGEGDKQTLENGIVFVTPSIVMLMVPVGGNGENDTVRSFLTANLLCSSTLLEAIDMSQNETLADSMTAAFNGALKSYEYTSSIMAWGYRFETKLLPMGPSIIASCSLS